jgi:hypothetical protein
MKYVIWVFAALLLFSCGQKTWTKRGYKNGWITSEIKYDTIITDSVSKDTVFRFGVIRDTVVLKEDKLTVKYFYNTSDSTVYLSGKCDPDTIRVEKVINNIETKESFNWTWIMIAFCLGILIALVIVSKFRN